MRVLHLIDSLSGAGGAEQGLVREITRFDAEVGQHVVLLYDRTDLAHELTDRGIPVTVIGLEEGSGSRTWPRAVPPARRVAKEFGPDVIQTSLFLGNIVGQMVGRSLGLPVVSNLVLSGNPELLRNFQPGAGSWRAGLLRSIAGWVARSRRVTFRALTEEVRSTNARLLGVPVDRVTVIPRGVPAPDLGNVADRESLGLPAGPLVLNVGRLAAQKGQVLLVEAFARVREKVPAASLVIVGKEGPAGPELRDAIARLGLEPYVHLVGHSTRVVDYLAQAHVFAFSSVMEGLGTSVLEAMACGVPVVAFDIPPVREATADGRFGSLVPVGDVAALAGAIVDLVKGARQVDTEAREWVRTRHDMDRIASEVQALLARAAMVGPGSVAG